MRTEQLGEKFRLRLAELRKPLGGVGDRAVVLAQLLTLLRVGGTARGGSVPVRGERPGQGLGALLGAAAATASRYEPAWAAIRARANAAIAPSPPSRSPIHRRASTASSSYDWSKASRPQSVRAKTLAGRPRVRAP